MLDDETLRDGLQSPSVRNPTLDEKIDILHRMDALGIDTADIGLPGAGPKVAADVEGLARAIVEERLTIHANCAARTVIADISRSSRSASGRACRSRSARSSARARSASTPKAGRSTSCCSARREAIGFAVKEGLSVMYVTEDTTRADPESIRRLYTAAIRAGASRVCIADTVGHATPSGATAVVTFVKSLFEELGVEIGIDWHGHRDRGLGVACAIAALEAGATRLHGAALGIGERCGNTPMDLLLVNLAMLGYIDRDLTTLGAYCEAVSRACDVPIPSNYPVVGADAFRTATGVHAAAVVKAFRKRFDLRQRGEHDVADHLQAARADGVERVLRRVPRLVVEIDDVHRRHAGARNGRWSSSTFVASGMK